MIGISLIDTVRGLRPGLAAIAVALLLTGCTRPQPGAEFNDPFEEQNRAVHAENVALDRTLFGGDRADKKPFLPEPVADGLINVAKNLGTPSDAVNSLLQFRLKPALTNTLRFAINSTLGIGGIFDPASEMGLYAEETDFGETLHVWGAPEGAFLVLPVMGPTTERDLAGTVVDAIIDPLGLLTEAPESTYITGIKLAGKVAKRQKYGDAVDSVIHDSADSYAQMRLIYLQNRHFELGIEADVIDPYEDPYAN